MLSFSILPMGCRALPAAEILRVTIGLLLLAAAGFKGYGLAAADGADPFSWTSPRLQLAAMEVETVLAVWLLSRVGIRGAWGAAIVFFSITGAMSCYQAVEGQLSCGCFGRLMISPWITFVIDLAALAGLAFFRPVDGLAISVSWFRGVVQTLVGASGLLALLGVLFLLVFDDPAAALAELRGESITVAPAFSQVGDAA